MDRYPPHKGGIERSTFFFARRFVSLRLLRLLLSFGLRRLSISLGHTRWRTSLVLPWFDADSYCGFGGL